MPYVSDKDSKAGSISLQRVCARAVPITLGIIALAVAMFTWGEAGPASAQTDADCEATDLGAIDFETDNRIEVNGRWTSDDCDSEFLSQSYAKNYKFDLPGPSQVRIELSSSEGDAYLHLLNEDGGRISHDDDSGPGLNARIEANLEAGTYIVEAAQASGRLRAAAGFTLTLQRSTNCDAIDLGALVAGSPLTAEGEWTVESCGARFRDDTPSNTYRFQLLEESAVRIELVAPDGGDPFLYLLTGDGAYIYSDDDSAAGRNSMIENDLPAGTYLIEATTYGDREHGHELTEFTLTIDVVDEDRFLLKAEDVFVPEPVVAGQPVTIHYRVGNAGRMDLPGTHSAAIGIYGRGIYSPSENIPASEGNWEAGASYHSDAAAAIPTSVTHEDLKPVTVTFNRPGDSYVFLGIATYEQQEGEEAEEVAFSGLFKEFVVLDGFAFDPVKVRVDGLEYEVSAVADEEGKVTASVTSAITPDAELSLDARAEALYTAGVRTQKLEGLFDRPIVDGLSIDGDGEATSVANPSSKNLMMLFGRQYATALRETELRTNLREHVSVNPQEVEDLLVAMSETASARAVSMVSTWKGLDARVGDASPMTFTDAFALHSQLSYTEKVLAPLVAAGEIVEAAREAETGWEDEEVQSMMEDFEDTFSCRNPASIAIPLRRANILDLPWMLTADTEMRAALPFYETAADAVLCGNWADNENEQFFENLFIDEAASMLQMFDIAPPPTPTVAPYRLRVLSRLVEDGRIEHWVELSSGEQIMPESRHLPADATVDEWVQSSDVIVGEETIGKIQSRRLEDGRVEVGYVTVSGRAVEPNVRYLPSDMPEDVWFRSSNVTAPRSDSS